MREAEIVLGESFYHTMKKCDFAVNSKIIKFEHLLSVAIINNMEIKYDSDFVSFIKDEIYYDMNNNYSIEKFIKKIDKSIKDKDKIRVWMNSNEVDSYLMFLLVLNRVGKKNVSLAICDSKKDVIPSCMNEKELKQLLKSEHILTEEEKNKYKSIIDNLKNDKINFNMYVVNNKRLKKVTYDYYNDKILKKVRKEKQISVALLVSYLMDSLRISEVVTTYLVNRLVNNGKLIFVNKKDRFFDSIITINDKKYIKILTK